MLLALEFCNSVLDKIRELRVAWELAPEISSADKFYHATERRPHVTLLLHLDHITRHDVSWPSELSAAYHHRTLRNTKH